MMIAIEEGDSSEEVDLKSVSISTKAQGKTRVELSFTGTPGSTVGLNVIEYDAVIQGLSNEITKERLLQYLTRYEQVPIVGMPTMTSPSGEQSVLRTRETERMEEHGNQYPSKMSNDDERTRQPTGGDVDAEKNMEIRGDRNDVRTSSKFPSSNLRNNEKSVPMTREQMATMKQQRGVVSEDEEEQHIGRERLVSSSMIFLYIYIYNLLFCRDSRSVIQLKRWFLVLAHHATQNQLKVMMFIQHQTWDDSMVMTKADDNHHTVVNL
jgi:hypothetical protein